MTSVVFEVPVSVSPQAMWEGVVMHAKGRCPFPEMVPEVYASVEGPWLHEGSVVGLKFNNGLKDCKWTFTQLDAGAVSVKFTWVEEEGPMAKRNHVISIAHVATGEASCSINFSMHFDGEVGAEYAQAFKEALTQTALLFSSRLSSTAQPN